MKNTILITSLIVLTSVLFTPSTATGQFFFMENENIGKKAQDFSLDLANGEKMNMEKFRDGKKAVVFFWATWCPHCRVQLGELNANKKKLEKDKIKLVLVDIGESAPIVNKYLEKAKIDFDVFLDVESKVADQYGLIGVPTFYFIDEKGIVKDVQHSLPEDLNTVFTKS